MQAWRLGLAVALLRRPERQLDLAEWRHPEPPASHTDTVSLVDRTARGVVIHDHARAVEFRSAQDMECSRNTGATCLFAECAAPVAETFLINADANTFPAERGNVTCEAGVCSCEEGFCSDGHGSCTDASTGEWLDETRTIKGRTNDEYIYLTAHGGAELSWTADEKAQWHVLINSDKTVVFRNVQYSDKYLGVLLECHSEMTKSRVRCATEIETSAPSDVAFEAMKWKTGSKAVEGQGVMLRHIKSQYYLGDHLHAFEFDWNAMEWEIDPPLPDSAITFSNAAPLLVAVSLFWC